MVVPPQAVTYAPPAPKKKSGAGAIIGLIAVAVIAVLLLALNAVQYLGLVDLGSPHVGDLQARVESAESHADELENQLKDAQKELDDYRSETTALLEENTALNQQKSDLESQLADAQNKLWAYENSTATNDALRDNYNKIVKALSEGTPGRASDKFKVDKGTIVLKKSASPVTVTLTADFGAYVSITTDRTGSAAEMTFNQSSWSGTTTTLKVTPKSAGVTTVKFTNNIDSQTFTVLIVVTE